MSLPHPADIADDTLTRADLRGASAADLRAAIRKGRYDGQTAGLAAGKLQCNLAILPAGHALDFLRFRQRNPKPCPVVGISDTAIPACRPWATTSTSAPMCPATASSATAT